MAGSPVTTQVNIRVPSETQKLWREAAAKHGKTLSDFIRDTVNEAMSQTLDCDHPLNMRTFYDWANVCLKCGERV